MVGLQRCLDFVGNDSPSPLPSNPFAASHEHEEHGELIPMVKSPRVGMCGYEGLAEVPY
jgi:hypothetical protein